MNALFQSSILFLIWAIILLRNSYKIDAGQHKRHKILHALCATCLIISHSTAFRMLGWAIGNPSRIIEHFYVEKGVLPPQVTFGIWVLNTMFSIIAVTLGLRLTQRKEASLRWVFKLVPAIAFVDWLEMFKGLTSTDISAKGHIASGVIITLFVIIPYGLMLSFYSKPNVQLSIFGIKKNSNNRLNPISGSRIRLPEKD